ncbi:MAG TPA: Maf family protein [Sedimentisphaerales bacterium]|jgi:septum formation protein|nr:Maf family protein [Sedimentisphaerales bacterium]HNU29834.1 Maf family protein [Sedimentisphaerales bacterium]
MQMILASTSPRRRQLLTEAGYAFRIVAPRIDESTIPRAAATVRGYAEELAAAKARSVAPDFPDALVIGADTLCDLDGQVIGKAADAGSAEQITRALFSKPHLVITGLALIRLSRGIEIICSEVTTVYPRRLTESQIAAHVAGGGWEGKAGAYAIQEVGDAFVERIEGSFTNVMGMPMELLQRLLADLAGR